MARPFGLVDDKLHEADFFLGELETAPTFMHARYFFNAFSTAARAVTFVLQSSMHDVPGFDAWYEAQRAHLRSDPVSKFFHRVRTESQKIGTNAVAGGVSSRSGTHYFVLDSDAPSSDAVQIARAYMIRVVGLIHECYAVFGATIDPDQYYQLANTEKAGLTIEDIEDELGFPRGWTDVAGVSLADRLNGLRRHIAMSSVDPLFEKYLGKPRPNASTV